MSGPDVAVTRVLAPLGAAVLREHGELVADVPAGRWAAAAELARDALGFGYFDLLTAVDRPPGGVEVLLRLWSVRDRLALRLRTLAAGPEPAVDTLSGLFGGAGWHERHVAEMFGVAFAGHPDPAPLLLGPDAGHPLRKDRLLPARQAPWPGAKDPGESDADLAGTPRRRRSRPLGVPRDGR